VLGQVASLITIRHGLHLPLTAAIPIGVVLAAIPALVMRRRELQLGAGSYGSSCSSPAGEGR
jgi:hypothetical protein